MAWQGNGMLCVNRPLQYQASVILLCSAHLPNFMTRYTQLAAKFGLRSTVLTPVRCLIRQKLQGSLKN